MSSQLPWKAGEHASRTVRSPRAMFLVALVGAGVAVPFITSSASAAGTAGPAQSVLVSSAKDRGSAVSLAERTLTGNAFIFVRSDARRVQFYLDKPTTAIPTSIEKSAPFDLAGTGTSYANALDTRLLSTGTHKLIVRALDNSSNYWSTSTTSFTVSRTAAVTPPPVVNPPVVTPPVVTPPVVTPPVITPPVVTPPVETPPVITPPVVTPPVVAGRSYNGSVIIPAWLPPAGFPGPANTGVPAGVALTPSNGDMIIRTSGALIDGLDIKGCVSVRANNVVIKNTRISCGVRGGAVKMNDNNTNFVMQDSEIDGLGLANATYGNNITMVRTEMHNLFDGPRLGSNVRYEANWIHDLVRTGDSHNDGFQTTGASNVIVRGNSVQSYSFDVNDPHNSVIMIGTEVGPALSNWVVEGNYFDGGAVSINMRTDATVTGSMTFRANQFGPNSRFQKSRTGLDRSFITWASNNIWAASGAYTTQ